MVTYKPAAEQNAVRLTQNTTLAFDKLNLTAAGTDVVSDTELDLKAGKIYASVKKFNALSQYTVKIPKASPACAAPCSASPWTARCGV